MRLPAIILSCRAALSLVLFLVLFTACAGTGFTLQQKETVTGRIDAYGIELDKTLIEFFSDIAFGSEYSGGNELVTWNKPIRIKVLGTYSEADYREAEKVVQELDQLLPTTRLHLVDSGENITMLFTDQQGFDRYAPEYAKNNIGYFHINWHPKTKYVTTGRILIRSKGIIQTKRNHVIREEITQILGLMRDSDDFKESIFYQGYSETNHYSEKDKQVILLWDALKPFNGRPKDQVIRFLYDIADGRD